MCVYTGTYTVVVTLNGCSSAVSNSILVLPVGLNDKGMQLSVETYPNPSHGQFNVKVVTQTAGEYSLEVYNSLGSLLWKQESVLVSNTVILPVDLKGSPSGIYTVALRNKANSVLRKVVIMN